MYKIAVMGGADTVTGFKALGLETAEINKYRSAVTPAIILIPGRDGPLGTGRSALHDAVIRAVGADI